MRDRLGDNPFDSVGLSMDMRHPHVRRQGLNVWHAMVDHI